MADKQYKLSDQVIGKNGVRYPDQEAADKYGGNMYGSTPPDTNAGGTTAPPPAMAGLQAAGPNGAPAPTSGGMATPMPTSSPMTDGTGAAPSGAPSAGGTGSGSTTIQGQMEPGPGFVESGAGAGALRALGQRRPAEQSMALAGLSRAY